MFKSSWILLVLALLVLPAGVVLAAGVGGQPAAAHYQVLPLAQVEKLDLPAVDRQEARQEDDRRLETGEPYRFAEPRLVDYSPENSGTWEMLPNTDRLWRLRVSCPGVLSLNLGFSEFELPPGAVLRIYASEGTGSVLDFGEQDNRDHGQLWTPVLLTCDLVVELQVPAAAASDWRLRLSTVGCGYRFFGEENTDKSGACNIDVICPEGNGWRDEIATVGVYTVNGSWTCTGAMINNTDQDERPLFLTANHCDVYSHLAATVVVYWNFESPTCMQHGGGSLGEFTSGSTLLASYVLTDFALLELDNSPDPAFGVNLAGWDRSGLEPSSAVCIHHPSTDEKSISFEDDPLDITSYLQHEIPGDQTHLRVYDWDLGTTEPGSSGSPLFNPERLIVGQLHGGYAACGNDTADWYGRFSLSWTGGGTSATRLSSWLDPQGLGNLTMPLLVPEDGPVDPPAGNANIRISAMYPNPFLDFVEVTVNMDRAAVATTKVYDLTGKVIADLGSDLFGEGETTFGWDGYDQGGRRVPAGLYVLVVESEGKTSRRQFVRLN